MASLAAGTRVGPYVIVRELGHGGMASVYEAEHVGLAKHVAIKILRPDVAKNATAAARFEREGRAAARVRHPHVVDVTDVGVHDECPYLVMELVRGPTLAAKLRDDGPLPVARVAAMVLPVVSACARAHDAGVVHRDLKPANILLATDLHGDTAPKVTDFGISKLLGSDAELTQEHGVVGTLAYMAPEQLRRSAAVDARADQWALGVLLYEASTGELPFVGDTSAELIEAILHADIEPPSARRTGIPVAFDSVVVRALSRDPRDRFADVRELGAALLRFAEGRSWSTWAREFATERSGDTVDDDARPQPVSAARPERSRAWLVVAALAFVGAVSVWGSFALQRPASSATTALPPPAASTTIAPPPAVVASIEATAAPASSAPTAVSAKAVTPPRPPTTIAAPAASAPPAAPSPVAAPSSARPQLGSHGVPILE